jgi:hypothetical protein
MSEFAIVIDYERRSSSRIVGRDRQPFNPFVYFGRLERFKARRNSARDGAVNSAPQHLDAWLLQEGKALEDAWACEIATLILRKRLGTPEADAVADAARAICALVVERIEAAPAATLDGLRVKARAILWTRKGEPLGTEPAEPRGYKHA